MRWIGNRSPLEKSMAALLRQEGQMERAAVRMRPAAWRAALEKKLPDKVQIGLESAFCKAFSMVFSQGRTLLEKGINRDELLALHTVRDNAVRQGGRRELRRMDRAVRQSGLRALTLTTVEGVGLGALGIGMPDVVLFIATLLRSVYETSLQYGFDYSPRSEQMYILKLLETSMCAGEEWPRHNAEADRLADSLQPVSDADFQAQLQRTAAAFAMDMLLLKFVQGLPVVGIIGGAANPVYHRRVMRYVQLKYRKRYLNGLLKERRK